MKKIGIISGLLIIMTLFSSIVWSDSTEDQEIAALIEALRDNDAAVREEADPSEG